MTEKVKVNGEYVRDAKQSESNNEKENDDALEITEEINKSKQS